MDLNLINLTINNFIKNQIKSRNSNGVVLGISGGIDSAVVAFIAASALGEDRVLGLILPDEDSTTEEDISDAIKVCSVLNIEKKIIKINEPKNAFYKILENSDNNIVKGNLVSRIRMCILYYYSGLLNRIVLGTSNKTELNVGYFTKYGDGAADLLPIADLYKTQVLDLAKYLHVPENIINKKSSARLWKGQITEDEIGLPFNILDELLIEIDKNYNIETDDIISTLKQKLQHIPEDKLLRIISLKQKNMHKLSFPPICQLG